MTDPEQTPRVPVHPTLGDLDDLKRARAEHDATRPAPVPASHGSEYEPDEVVGGPTLGSIDELRFAHHAHSCEVATDTTARVGAGGESRCTCSD
jgi:hypothetical protein